MWEDEWAADMGSDAPKIKCGWNLVPDDKVWLSPQTPNSLTSKRKREEEEEEEKEKEEKKKLKSVKDFFAPLTQATFGAVPAAVAAAATPEERIAAAVAACLKKRATTPKYKPTPKKPKTKK
ncbi:hypothetical protein FNAPI_11860 [Fusarium napiforme]|uniref:Uncharacterized protein n=1 Tax=Fusarium napiforme TaxID=42672 RepID=A0A8H5IHU3_9HYPO|nr:hypothetical protein FNAPI_11860 [Fusarium napiforme]